MSGVLPGGLSESRCVFSVSRVLGGAAQECLKGLEDWWWLHPVLREV